MVVSTRSNTNSDDYLFHMCYYARHVKSILFSLFWTLGAPKSQVVTLINPITRMESKRQCQKLKHLKEIKRENMYQSFIQLQKKPMLYHNATQTGSRIDLEVQLENEVVNDTDSNEECT